MIETTQQLLISLAKCDTASVINLIDSSYAHLDQAIYRSYITGGIRSNCTLYNEITKKYGTPYLNKIVFSKDPHLQANIVSLSLLPKEDSVLNLKTCFLQVMFYPDQLFNGKVLSFSVSGERLKENNKVNLRPGM